MEGTALQVHYSVDESTNHFHVGRRSTFGHIEFSGAEDYLSIKICLSLLFQHISKYHQQFTIKFAPSFYFKDISDHIYMALKQLKNATVTEDYNQSMLIPACSDVVANFAKTNRRLYRRLEGNGYHVCKRNNLSGAGYDLLEENRRNRNVKLSLSYDALYAQVQKLEGNFHFFECRDQNDELCAYAVTLSLSTDWLYVLYWGEKPSHRRKSPVVMLAAEIMRYCQQENIKRLDAGISSVVGEIDHKLFEFKRRLGFIHTPKLIVSGGL